MITPLEILARVDAHTVASEDQSPRNYLGASEIGEKCLRKLFYKFRWCGREQFDGRMLRLFARGDREEPVVCELLEGAGFIVSTPAKDGETDFQFKDCAGHFAGTADGVVSEDNENWYLLEIKTWKILGGGNFNDLKRQGVKECEPKYYAQMQTYMGQLGLENALFIAVCKENDDIHMEWVPFNRLDFEVCLSKAEAVIGATTPPDRISNDPKTFSCRYCTFNRLCHENIPLPQSSHHCRNCRFASPGPAGSWDCAKNQIFGEVCGYYQPVCGGTTTN